jgi:tRNA(Phe) wybutosine-synthesizing methylase Tyw3
MTSFSKNKAAKKIVDNINKEKVEQKKQDINQGIAEVQGTQTTSKCSHTWNIVIEGHKRHRQCEKCSAFYFILGWHKKLFWRAYKFISNLEFLQKLFRSDKV